MNGQRLVVIAGLITFALGLAAILTPGVAAFDLDQVLVTVVGLVALLQGFRIVQSRRRQQRQQVRTPDPEVLVTAPPPGGDLNEVLAEFSEPHRLHYRRTRVQEGLRAAAIAVLTNYGSCSEREAEEQIESGTWTDNTYAAAFLGTPTHGPSLPVRLRVMIRGESRFTRNVRHTVDAIIDRADLPPRSTRETATDIRQRATRGASIGGDNRSVSFDTVSQQPGVDVANGIAYHEPRSTGHWNGVSVIALVGIGIGVLVEQPAVLLAGVVGIGFAAYARSATLSRIDLSIDRVFSDERPEPGDEVEVTVTVRNESERLLPDLRLIDGVPDALAVTEGSPRLGTALRSGETTTLTYTVTARRGVHTFGSTLVLARDLTTAIEQEIVVETETTLTCLPRLRATTAPIPLREGSTQYTGRVATATGGEGIEFYATREHRPGDPMNRIDWNRRARTGEFATLEFDEEQAATVLVVIDVRDAAYIAPEPQAPHAVDRAVDAAGRIFAILLNEGDRVGVAAFGSNSCWFAPGTGDEHRVRARQLLATHPAFASVPQEERFRSVRWRRTLRRRLTSGTQILFISPLCDEYASIVSKRLDAYGYPVTVISPDPTVDRTVEQRLTRLGRTLRITDLRSTGIQVIDWQWDDSLDVTLTRFAERWAG